MIYERSCPVTLELDSDETRAKVGGKDITEKEDLLVKIAVKVSPQSLFLRLMGRTL